MAAEYMVNQPNSHETILNEADDDHDSAYESISASLTSSVASSIYKYRVENGRTYHAYKDGSYAYPNDELEMDRLDLQHHLFEIMLDGKLHLAPIIATPQCVLDVATGSGIWAMDFADQHPSAYVIANDLSPTQPPLVPPNVQFEIDDANDVWTYSRRFDFIHCRQHHCAIEERRLFRQSFEFLKPGGWIEMQELCYPIRSDDGSLASDSALATWSRLLLEATAKVGQAANKPAHYEQWMRDAGFVNTAAVVYKWPTNPWPKDDKLKTMGLWNHLNVLQGLQGFTIGLFTRELGWSSERTNAFLVSVRRDLQNGHIHAYWPIVVVYGQKPFGAE